MRKSIVFQNWLLLDRRKMRYTITMNHKLILHLQNELTAHANAEHAVAMAAYMKTTMPFYGVKAPERRAILKEALTTYPINDSAACIEVITQLWQCQHREEKYCAIDIARAHRKHLHPDMLPLFEMMIRTGAWWDFVDEIAMHLVGTIVLKHPHVWPIIEQWSRDDDMWIRRTAIICQNRFKNKTDAQRLFAYCVHNMHDKDFFIRKAIGWALREYAKTDAAAVLQFVEMHTAQLAPLSYREAIKHL